MSGNAKAPSPGFPEDHILPFFLVGQRRGKQRPGQDLRLCSDAELCELYDVRSFLYFLLLAFGALRSSEPFHLFLADIAFDFVFGRGAEVLLLHPATGVLSTGGKRWSARKDYLKTEFGLEPRNSIRGHARAGWKNLLLDEADHLHGRHTRVYWVLPEMGLLFWRFHQAYVSCARPRVVTHPYYFASQWGDAYGRPWTLDAAADKFERSVRAIGLEPSSARGICMHGFRHRVVHWMKIRGVPPETRKIVLHHRKVESQDAYGLLGPCDVSAMLSAATSPLPAGHVAYADLFPQPERSSRLDAIGRELAATFLRSA